MGSTLNADERDQVIDVLESVSNSTCGFHMFQTAEENEAVHELLSRLQSERDAFCARFQMAATGRTKTDRPNVVHGIVETKEQQIDWGRMHEDAHYEQCAEQASREQP